MLADEGWVRTIGELKGALMPGLEIKGFRTEDVEAAEAWLAESTG